ncbi:hypothetical protein BBJ28_00013270 [Nothophytophthora sp. Chile5]|nr:hypothetical protein BBJ28_00013270 [Nothophytophthora sp. Chile5]
MNSAHVESTTGKIERVRRQVLAFFSASEEEYALVFTSGATASLKLIGESFPWSEDSTFAHSIDSHTSVLGIRGYAAKHGSTTVCVGLDELEELEMEQETGASSSVPASTHLPEASDQAPMSLFAYPAECNFSGVRHPLSLVDQVRGGRWKESPPTSCRSRDRPATKWLVLVDAAKYVATQRLDLSVHRPDFVVLSFYKMFGYPTGLGALLVRKSVLPYLEKSYHGGGTVQSILASRNFTVPRGTDDGGDDGSRFADGTQSFLSILALHHGVKQLEKLGMANIEAHTGALTKLLFAKLSVLRHWNGRSICEIYGNHGKTVTTGKKRQGPVISCNFLRPDGSFVGYGEFYKLADIHNFRLRAGCFCNPGACQHYLRLKESDLLTNIAAGHVCGDDIDVVNGLPTGAVRLSLGYMTTFEDVMAFVTFVAKYFVSWTAPAEATNVANCLSVPRSVSRSTTKGPYLRKLTLFPIKSCAGMVVDTWPIGSRGLLYDREFAIVDSSTGTALSLKTTPELCFFHPVVDLGRQTLTITFQEPSRAGELQQIPAGLSTVPQHSSFVIPLHADISTKKSQDEDNPRNMRVCTGACKGRDVSGDVSRWLSARLGRQCSLVRVASDHLRASLATRSKHSLMKRPLAGQNPAEGDVVCSPNAKSSELAPAIGFANQAQYLLISRQSIDHFNSVLRSVDNSMIVHEDAFRANLVVDGCADSFEEDSWKCVQIGGGTFDVSGPCSRCSVINLDQRTGQFNRRPLQVLSSYRRQRSTIFFGQFLTARVSSSPSVSAPTVDSNGVAWLRVGDPVLVEVAG